MANPSPTPSHRRPEDLQPEFCDLCGQLIGQAHLIDADVEGLRGYTICDRHPFERQARVTPSYNDVRRFAPPPPIPDMARQEPIGGESWFTAGPAHRLVFDGVDDAATCTLACPAGALTLQAVVRPDTTAATIRYLHGWQNSNLAGGRALRFVTVGANLPSFLVVGDAGTVFQATGTESLAAESEYEVTGVLDPDAARLRLYVEGDEAAAVDLTGTFSTVLTAYTVAKQPGFSSNYLSGGLRRLRVWSRALSPYLIGMYRGLDLRGDETGLVSDYLLTEGEGTAAANNVDGKPDLTISGAVWEEVA